MRGTRGSASLRFASGRERLEKGALDRELLLHARAAEIFAKLLESGVPAQELRGGELACERGGVGREFRKIQRRGAVLLAQDIGPPLLERFDQRGALSLIARFDDGLEIFLALVEPRTCVGGLLVVQLLGLQVRVGALLDRLPCGGQALREFAGKAEGARDFRAGADGA